MDDLNIKPGSAVTWFNFPTGRWHSGTVVMAIPPNTPISSVFSATPAEEFGTSKMLAAEVSPKLRILVERVKRFKSKSAGTLITRHEFLAIEPRRLKEKEL